MSVPTRVGGRYRIDEPLARGGMASVYRGHDEQLDRPVAVKLMRAEVIDDQTQQRRFEAEALRAAAISDPHLVAIYDVGVQDDTPYIVMELVEGGDLATALAAEGPMAPERAARIGVDATTALEAAHAAGVTHRDIKPRNILLDADGRARVADFGIARATGDESLTRTGAVLGSVDYFSPEQARGERATPASDIYAMGVVLYELVTGRRPFRGDTPYAVATARLRQPPPDVRDTAPGVPTELAEIIRRAMARAPGERFESASDMRGALEAWLARDRAASTPPAPVAVAPAPDDAAPAERRRPAAPWLVATAILLLVVAGYAGMRVIGVQNEDGVAADPLEIIVGTPGGEARTPSESPSPSASPSASAPEATSEPSPVATARPAPTASPAPPASAAPTAQPPTPAPVAVAGGPDDSVAAFYARVVDGEFDAAYALWSDRMKATYPRQGNLDGRFADTASITFSQLTVVDQSATAATVQANFTERYDGGGSREFIGYWRLIRVEGTWLLDEPNY